jgi:hypothetical protein
MVAEARLKSKNLYKVELYLLKIMPMVIALAYLVNTVSSYFGVDIPILASIAGMSLIPLIFMYISSYVFYIHDEVGSIRYWALKIGKAHSVLSYRLKVHGIDNLRKYIEQRIKLV